MRAGACAFARGRCERASNRNPNPSLREATEHPTRLANVETGPT